MPTETILVIALCSLVTATISLPLLIWWGHRFGLLDQPGRHKRHKRPVPYLGGVALFVSVWSSLLVSTLLGATRRRSSTCFWER